MGDLTLQEVAALARLTGIQLSDDDLREVTHRLNVIVAALQHAGDATVDAADPFPIDPRLDLYP